MTEIRKFRIETNYIKLLSAGALLLFPILQSYSIVRSLGFPSLFFPIFIYFVLAIAILYKVMLVFSIKKSKTYFSLIVIWGVLLFIITIIFLSGFKFGFDPVYRTQYFATFQTGVIYALLCFLIGLDFESILDQLNNNRRFRQASKLSILILLFTVVFSIIINYKEVGDFQIKYSEDYLAISDGIAVSLLVIFALIKKVRLQWVLLPIFIIILFGTISRGSMLAFIGAIFSYKIISLKMQPIKIFSLFIGFILLIFSFIFLDQNRMFLYTLFGQSRGVDILMSLIFNRDSFFQNDPSMVARVEMLHYGLSDLKNVWFFGSFMRDAEMGIGYVHNWLSFWLNFGLIPFVLFSFTYITSLIKCTSFYRRQSDKTMAIVILVSFYTLFQVVFFRAYVYATIWFSLAALVSLGKKSKIYRAENNLYKLGNSVHDHYSNLGGVEQKIPYGCMHQLSKFE